MIKEEGAGRGYEKIIRSLLQQASDDQEMILKIF